jgi:hypothetical protein
MADIGYVEIFEPLRPLLERSGGDERPVVLMTCGLAGELLPDINGAHDSDPNISR